jgi:hypothetical protein
MDLLRIVCASDKNYYYYQAYEGVCIVGISNTPFYDNHQTIKQNAAVNIKNSNGTSIYNIIIFLLQLLLNLLKYK